MQTLDATVAVAVIGVLGTCVGGLIWVIKKMFNEMIPAITGLTNSVETNTTATKNADRYIRQRNGRDAQLAQELVKTTLKSHDELVEAVHENTERLIEMGATAAKALKENPITQKVEKQEVKTQVIKEVV